MRLYLNKSEIPTVEKGLRFFKNYCTPNPDEKKVIENVLKRMELLKISETTKITIIVEEG